MKWLVLVVVCCVASCADDSTSGDGAGAEMEWTTVTDPGGSSTGDACTSTADCIGDGQICDMSEGACVEPSCSSTQDYCLNLQQGVRCEGVDEPRAFECEEGSACFDGLCQEQVCDPEAPLYCEEGKPYECMQGGTYMSGTTCFGGRVCIEDDCRPILHNIMLLFDTSYSMNNCADGSYPDLNECCPGGCMEDWPVCETASKPVTKLGVSKQVFSDFFAGLGAQKTGRFSLLTFPQEEIEFHSFCTSGYYSERAYLPGDNDEHMTTPPPSGWFHQGREQVVRVPFAERWSESNTEDLLSWVDFVEEQGSNPELRGSGQTPLGRSMFYAGEYLKHYVVVDGKACSVDADCGSADYVCVDGACEDPVRHCRRNVLLVFTDGEESASPLANDFYHPIVQARRMKFGLGCQSDEDCLGGATCSSEGLCIRAPQSLGPCALDSDCAGDAYCVSGQCAAPGFEWPESLGTCSQSGIACMMGVSGECTGFFEQCQALDAKYSDGPSGSNHLVAQDGSPIEVTTHVINLDPDTAQSELIAEHGGGLHFGADLSSPELLKAILQRAVDLKYGVTCVGDDEAAP